MPTVTVLVVVLLTALLVAAAALWLRPPPWLLDLVSRRLDGARLRVATRTRAVALTFDDGPHPEVTPLILDRLAAHGARATFFVIGAHADGHGDLLAAIRAGGHELANHLYTDRMTAGLSSETLRQELEWTDARIFPPGSPAPARRWCRPGHGFLTPRLVRLFRERGYEPVLASAYPIDIWMPIALAVRHTLANVRPGAILVLHDGSPARLRTVETLGRLLPAITARGYRLVTLSALDAGRAKETS